MQKMQGTMRNRITILTLTMLLFVLVGGLAGCKGKRFTIDSAIHKAFGADDQTPEEMAAAAFDENDPDVRRGAVEKLSHKRWALRDPYLKRFAALTDPRLEKDSGVRAVCIRALGKAGNAKYTPEIIRGLSDPSPVVRWDAATVLGGAPNKHSVTKLQKLAIQDPSMDVRMTAAWALRHHKTDSVYRTLLRCLNDEKFDVRASAHKALVWQTGTDKGYDPENWARGKEKVGKETLPPPPVRYIKRPWWDWFGVTKETKEIDDK
jgi:HEAT repeat protein